MKNTIFIMGVVFLFLGITLTIATIVIGISVYNPYFNSFRGPFIVLGLGQGVQNCMLAFRVMFMNQKEKDGVKNDE